MQTFLQALLRRAVQKLQNWKKKLSALLNFFTRFTLFLQKDCAKIWHYYKNGGGKSVKLNHSCNFPSYTRHFFCLTLTLDQCAFYPNGGHFSKPHVPSHRLGLWFRSMTLKIPRSMLFSASFAIFGFHFMNWNFYHPLQSWWLTCSRPSHNTRCRSSRDLIKWDGTDICWLFPCCW